MWGIEPWGGTDACGGNELWGGMEACGGNELWRSLCLWCDDGRHDERQYDVYIIL